MNLRRISSDAASGFPSLFITVILRMPVMALGHLLQRRLHLLLLRLDPLVAVVLGGDPLLFLPPPGIHACRPQVPLDAREYVQAPRRLGVLAPQGLGVQRGLLLVRVPRAVPQHVLCHVLRAPRHYQGALEQVAHLVRVDLVHAVRDPLSVSRRRLRPWKNCWISSWGPRARRGASRTAAWPGRAFCPP